MSLRAGDVPVYTGRLPCGGKGCIARLPGSAHLPLRSRRGARPREGAPAGRGRVGGSPGSHDPVCLTTPPSFVRVASVVVVVVVVVGCVFTLF